MGRKLLKTKQLKFLTGGPHRDTLCLTSNRRFNMNIDTKEALRRLNSPSNLVNSMNRVSHVTLGNPHRGRSVPEFLRDTIGALASTSSQTQQEIGTAFGVSQEAVSTFKSGKIGGRPANEARKAKLEERTAQIKDTALLKLMQSLNLIDDSKLEDLDAKGLSQVACNMSKVVNSLTEQEQVTQPVNIIVYSPETKNESRYRVVDV